MLARVKFFTTALLIGCLGVITSASWAEEKVVRVGTEPSFAPFEFMDEKTSELVGFDIDFMNALAKAANFKVEWVQMPFDGIIPAVITGTLDCAISGFTMNEERKRRVAFSEPYYMAGQSAMIHKNYKDKIKSFADLKNQKICAQIGSVGSLLAEKIEGAEVVNFNTTAESYMELDKGGCVAFITGTPVQQFYLVQTHNDNMILLPEIVNAAGLGVVTSKNNTEMKKLIDEAFLKIKADGTYQKIYDKWVSAQ